MGHSLDELLLFFDVDDVACCKYVGEGLELESGFHFDEAALVEDVRAEGLDKGSCRGRAARREL